MSPALDTMKRLRRLHLWLLFILSGLCGCSNTPRHAAGLDGTCNPRGKLVLSGHTLYGTTSAGESWLSSANGAVFKINTDGSGFTVLHRFVMAVNPAYTNRDGSAPMAGLVLSGDWLYGTAAEGGGGKSGTVFKVKTDGRDFAVLHTFNGSDGARPMAGLVLSGDTLYGTTQRGGHNEGVIFKVNTDGNSFAVLHAFTKLEGEHGLTNSDGAFSQSELALSGRTLYGTTWSGGSGCAGTVFKVNTDGTDFKVLHGFAKGTYYTSSRQSTGNVCNRDGAILETGLTVSGNCLYGISSEGGEAGSGTVFKMNTDGSDFAVLHSFTEMTNSFYGFTNVDGARPTDFILSGHQLMGVTAMAGGKHIGTVFTCNTDGSDFTVTPGFYGRGTVERLTESGKMLYGTTTYGGENGGGIVFKVNVNGAGFKVLHSFVEKPLPPGLSD